MLSMRWNPFRVCSAGDEIRSPYAEHIFNDNSEMGWDFPVCWAYAEIGYSLAEHTPKSVTRWLSIRRNRLLVGWAYAEIGYSLAEHTRKSFTRWLSIRGNCLLVGWAYAEINFVHTQLSRSLIRVFIRTVPCFLPIPLSPFSRPLPNVLCSLFTSLFLT